MNCVGLRGGWIEVVKVHLVWLAVLLPAVPAWADDDSSLTWILATEARYEDNIGFAPDNPSKRDVVTTHVQGGVTWQPLQTAQREVLLAAAPYYDYVSDLTDLSNGGAIGTIMLLQQFSPEFTSPWVSLESEFKWMSFKDSDIRNGYTIDTELTLGKRFSEKFALTVGYRYQVRVSTENEPEGTLIDPIFGDRKSDEVFDQERQGPFVNVEFDPFARTTLFVEYSYLTGDVAATADAAGFNKPDDFESARDFAFNEGIRFLVWKVDADQNVYTFGATQVLSRLWQVDVTADYLDAKGESGNNYNNFVVTVGASVSF